MTAELVAGPTHETTQRVSVVRQPVDYDRFYASTYPALCRLAFVLTGSSATSEDLAQETMVRAYRSWTKVSVLESPLGWCRRVLMNLVFSRTRKLRSEAAIRVRLGARQAAAHDEGWLADSDREFWAAVRSLPRRQAQVVALRYGADLSGVEIAEQLGLDAASVRSYLHQARRQLATSLSLTLSEGDDHETR